MFYQTINYSKQSVHQLLEMQMKTNETFAFLRNLITDIRADHPTLSCRAMYYKINPETIGRDKFERFCYQEGFMLEISKKYIRTTNSFGVIRFDNLLENTVLTDINQAFSSDITYFEIGDIFYYLTFVIDCFSRRIIGHAASKRLTTEQTTLPALQMAIKTRKTNLPKNVIFHSDGGGQYYDKEFIKITKKFEFRNSMCEQAYQNGKAERVNGTIKNNYLNYYNIKNFDDLCKMLDRAVSLYNNGKPHKSLNYKTPVVFEKELLYLHRQNKPKMPESFDG
jgi:transposase InsO family protein